MSGYDWVTEILVWGYAPAGGRRPLFRVWGYAPTRESVISHILSHTKAIIAMDLHRKSLERAPRSTWWRTSRVHDPSRVARRAAAAGYNLRRPLRRGREFKTLVGVSQGYARKCSPAFRVRTHTIYGRWPFRGTGVCSVGRPPDRPQCMGVYL